MGEGERVGPIHSSYADDPTRGDAIERFVLGLAERVDHLQDLEARSRFATLAVLADALTREAEATGFGALTSTAGRLAGAARGEKADAVHRSLLEVTELARRIRLGHSGAL